MCTETKLTTVQYSLVLQNSVVLHFIRGIVHCKPSPTIPNQLFSSVQETTESLTAKVHGNIGGVDIPWFGVDENACNDLTVGDCPVEGNEKIYYSAHVPILSSYPAVSSNIFCSLFHVFLFSSNCQSEILLMHSHE